MKTVAFSLVGLVVASVVSSWCLAVESTGIPELALRAMEYRVGEWESTGFVDGVKQATLGGEICKWTQGRYAISLVGHFEEDGKEVHGTGLIGWDPERRQLVEEWYTSDGSKANFCYTLDQEKQAGIGSFTWIYSDGRKVEGKSIVQVKTDDEWEWKATYAEDGKDHSWQTINRRVK